MNPTCIFKPFGPTGPKIVLGGISTGDWRISSLQKNLESNPGLYHRFCVLGTHFGFSKLLAPLIGDCDAEVCEISELPTIIQGTAGSLPIYRGCKADGMVLRYGCAGVIASADCPTAIISCLETRIVIMLHCGLASLVDIDFLKNGVPTRKYFSVVDAGMEKVKSLRLTNPQVFITCGIKTYERKDIANVLRKKMITQGVDGSNVDLITLIKERFARYGINNITRDTVDTFNEKSESGRHLWHSYRRNRKSCRNLVLVVNK